MWLSKLKIRTRIVLGMALLLLLVMNIIMPFVLSEFLGQIHRNELRQLEKLYQTAVAEIDSTGRLSQALATLIANSPSIQKAFSEGDRQSIAAQTLPLYQAMKERYDATQLQFHTPPATSFYRAHKPEKFGDDLSSFRFTVLQVNQSKQPVMGLENGVAGLGNRGVVPVFYEGKLIGSVEFGLSFGQPFFESFKQKYQVDIALLLHSESNRYQQFAGTFDASPWIDQTVLDAIFTGQSRKLDVEISGKNYALYLQSVKDFSGKPIGVLTIAMDRSEAIASVWDVNLKLVGLGVVALTIGIIIAILIGRGITRPIVDATQAMKRIAEGDGDLSQQMSVKTRDEMAQLARAFNLFVGKIHDTMAQISDVTHQLVISADETARITETSRASATKQQSEVEQVATAMNQVAITVQEMAQHANMASDSAAQADAATTTGKQIVSQVIALIEELATKSQEAVLTMGKLNKQTQSIDSVLEVIRNIADQTNLLALNAAIEAARAGEQGRGFAVVADEVRTLASRTQTSTQEIQRMIESLQGAANSAESAMLQSDKITEQCVSQIRGAGEALDNIHRAVGAINDMNSQIANSVTEQSAVSSELNINLHNINDGVTQFSNNVAHVATCGENVNQLSVRLNGLLNKFKL
ncbi:methyl-accepting chemotaxis protein [Vibrio metoecus]